MKGVTYEQDGKRGAVSLSAQVSFRFACADWQELTGTATYNTV